MSDTYIVNLKKKGLFRMRLVLCFDDFPFESTLYDCVFIGALYSLVSIP